MIALTPIVASEIMRYIEDLGFRADTRVRSAAQRDRLHYIRRKIFKDQLCFTALSRHYDEPGVAIRTTLTSAVLYVDGRVVHTDSKEEFPSELMVAHIALCLGE